MDMFNGWLRMTAAVLIACASITLANAEPLKITVYGGSGNIGQRIVHEALQRGHAVTVVSRDPKRVKDQGARLAVQQGNVLEPEQIAKLVAGSDVVISAVGADRRNNPDWGIYRKAGESLVSALRSMGAKAPRLIVVGGAGSLEVAPGVLLESKLPKWIRPEAQGQKEALDFYRTVTDVQWTYFSPAARISAGRRTGKFRLGGEQQVTDAKGNSKISIEDYAVALLDEAEQLQHLGQRFTIGY